MIRWLRVVALPEAMLLALAGYAVLLTLYWMVPARSLRPSLHGARAPTEPLLLILFFFALVYGAYRVGRFHPVFDTTYRNWLAAGPWAPGRPLPKGPVSLVPQDAVVVGALTAAGWWPHEELALYVPWFFLFGYLGTLAGVLIFTRQVAAGFAALAGLGGVLVCLDRPVLGWAVGLAAYAVAWVGFRRSLAGFPWEERLNALDAQKAQSAQVGWPFAALGPVPPKGGMWWWDAVLLGPLLGWWVFVAVTAREWFTHRRLGDDAVILSGVLALGVAAGRFLIYVAGTGAPISLFGRLATGRLIIPRYDQVYFGPVVGAVVGWAVPSVLGDLGVADIVAGPVGLACAVPIILTAGPSLREWRLSAEARLKPDVIIGQPVRLG